MRKLTLFVMLTLFPGLSGCFNTRDIPAGQLHKIMLGQQGKELILRTDKGKPVRFGPRSSIRFLLTDNRWSKWYRGNQLRVNRLGVCVEKRCIPPQRGWRWGRIHSAQVKNLAGGKTYAAVFITVAVVAVTVAVIAAAAGGKGGGGNLKLGKLFRGRGGGRVLRGGGRGGGRLSGLRPRGGARVGGLRPRGGARFGPRRPYGHGRGHRHPVLRVDPPGSSHGLSDLPPPEPDPDAPPTRSATDTPPPPPADAERPPGSPTQPLRLTLHATPGKTSHIFARKTRRRAMIRFIGLVEGGGDLLLQDGGTAQALVGMRILDVLELAAGAHLMIHRGERQDGPHSASWMGVFRVNLHFDLGARRRVALPIGFDVGAGHATIYARLNLGIRVRLTKNLSLGVYPFNPTYAEFKNTDLRRKSGWWSFPSTIDLSFAL